MSEKKRWPISEAKLVGDQLVAMLAPFCERIEIAGSIRCGRPMVGDVEILYLPKKARRQRDLIDEEDYFPADEEIEDWLRAGVIKRRASSSRTGGIAGWGKLNKLGVHVASGIPVDLFCEPNEADWWRSLVIRTGPAEMNIRLIQAAAARGIKMHAYGEGFTREDGEAIRCGSEEDVFAICGVLYSQPENRK
jgi:DNA polymerase/3'-5' exonuclease PolX